MKIISKLKNVFIVLIGTILTLVLHGLTSANSTVPKDANWGFLVSRFGFETVTVVYFIFAFTVFCYVYFKQQHNMPYERALKGLNYGVAIAIIWLWGMVEGVALQGNSFANELTTGLCDAIPIAVMGLLLGFFSKKSSKDVSIKKIDSKKVYITIFTITIVFILGRYILYSSNIIDSGYLLRKFATFSWTLIMGLCFAVSYLLLKSSTINIAKFCVQILLPNYIVFVIFMPLIFKGIWLGAILRVFFDILLVSLGGYIVERFIKNY